MKGNYLGSFLESHAKKIKMLGIYTTIILFVFCGLIIVLNNEWEKRKTVATGAGIHETSTALEQASAKTAAEVNKITQITNEQTTDANAVKDPVVSASTGIQDIVWPVRGEILQGVGIAYSRTFSDYRYHNGLDIKVKRGAEVLADLDGRVSKVETSKGEGKKIVIAHSSGWQSIYSHLTEVYVKTNETLTAGKRLGMVGQPGLNEILDEPHLHFELLKDGKTVDPLDYLPK